MGIVIIIIIISGNCSWQFLPLRTRRDKKWQMSGLEGLGNGRQEEQVHINRGGGRAGENIAKFHGAVKKCSNQAGHRIFSLGIGISEKVIDRGRRKGGKKTDSNESNFCV